MRDPLPLQRSSANDPEWNKVSSISISVVTVLLISSSWRRCSYEEHCRKLSFYVDKITPLEEKTNFKTDTCCKQAPPTLSTVCRH